MSPTSKDTLEVTTQAAATQAVNAAKTGSFSPAAQAVCIEIPIRVRGSIVTAVVQGLTEHTEPFQEETSTLIVFPKGAVARISAPVMTGQVVVITNLKTNQAVLCRVVNVKNQSNAQGYVEIEFTHRAPGFWGVTFPSEPSKPAGEGVVPATPAINPKPKEGHAATVPLVPSAARPTMPRLASLDIIEPKLKQVPTVRVAVPHPTSNVAPMSDSRPVAAERTSAKAAWAPPIEKPFPADAKIHLHEPKKKAGEEEPLDLDPLVTPVAVVSPSRARVEEPAASGDYWEPLEMSEPSAVPALPRAVPAEILGARLGQVGTDQPTREHHRNWALAAAGAFVFLLFLAAAGWFFLRQRPVELGKINSRVVPPASVPASGAIPLSPSSENPAVGTIPAQQNVNPAGEPMAGSFSAANVPALSSQPKNEEANSQRTAVPDLKQKASTTVPEIVSSNLPARPVAPERVAISTEPPSDLIATAPSSLSPGQTSSLIATASPPNDMPTPPPVPQPAVRVGGVAIPPHLLSSVMPIYPEIARQAHIQGDVTIQADIDAKGNVIRMKPIAGPPLLYRAAMDALRHWKYSASKLDGRPVPGKIMVTMKFRL